MIKEVLFTVESITALDLWEGYSLWNWAASQMGVKYSGIFLPVPLPTPFPSSFSFLLLSLVFLHSPLKISVLVHLEFKPWLLGNKKIFLLFLEFPIVCLTLVDAKYISLLYHIFLLKIQLYAMESILILRTLFLGLHTCYPGIFFFLAAELVSVSWILLLPFGGNILCNCLKGQQLVSLYF